MPTRVHMAPGRRLASLTPDLLGPAHGFVVLAPGWRRCAECRATPLTGRGGPPTGRWARALARGDTTAADGAAPRECASSSSARRLWSVTSRETTSAK